MFEKVLPDVLRMYGINYDHIFHYEKGYRNEIWPIKTTDGRMINVIFYKREIGSLERIRGADEVSHYLAERDMPTRQRIDRRTLQLRSSHGVTNVAVYNYLPGHTIPWEAYTMKHIKLLGKTMSDMHALLAPMSCRTLLSVYDEYSIILERMRRYFAQPTVDLALRQKLEYEMMIDFSAYQQLLADCRHLPGQPLHMDFVRSNILFSGNVISGILDFEKTSVGAPMVDIARTLAFLMVDCKYKSEEKVRKYFLQSGYVKRGAATNIGNDEMRESLIELFLVYDFYKFLQHNPYESLFENEHFIRTKNILSQRGIIRAIARS